jgi:hypothetical protein
MRQLAASLRTTRSDPQNQPETTSIPLVDQLRERSVNDSAEILGIARTRSRRTGLMGAAPRTRGAHRSRPSVRHGDEQRRFSLILQWDALGSFEQVLVAKRSAWPDAPASPAANRRHAGFSSEREPLPCVNERRGAGSLGSGSAEAPGVELMRVDCYWTSRRPL